MQTVTMTTEERLEYMSDKVEEAEQERNEFRRRLVRAVDRLADLDLIENNPHSKFLYVEGQKEL